jgi:hypothetical protein
VRGKTVGIHPYTLSEVAAAECLNVQGQGSMQGGDCTVPAAHSRPRSPDLPEALSGFHMGVAEDREATHLLSSSSDS